jgi:hypothetical protein
MKNSWITDLVEQPDGSFAVFTTEDRARLYKENLEKMMQAQIDVLPEGSLDRRRLEALLRFGNAAGLEESHQAACDILTLDMEKMTSDSMARQVLQQAFDMQRAVFSLY